jgi:hypothetical protein
MVSCQNIQNNETDYIVIKRRNAGIVNPNGNIKKYSKKQIQDLEFCNELASTLSKDLLRKIDKIIICEETATIKKKDTITYVVYDFILKKEVNIEQLKNSLNFGIKPIDTYEMPIICTSFWNDDKISFVSRGYYQSDFIKKEEFINTIKSDTELRINNSKINKP